MNDIEQESGIKQYTPSIYKFCDISETNVENFRHSSLEYTSGKNGNFVGVDFSYSIMTDCYFHNAKFVNCKFIGARMYRCNFRGAIFENCRFDYIDANETKISVSQVLKNMPDYPNVGREIAQVMRRNANSLGDVSASRKFILYEIDQKREHIRRALRGEGEYYKNKYGTFWKKLSLRWNGFLLWADSFVWGHGERVWRLLFCAILLVLFSTIVALVLWWRHNQGASLAEIGVIFRQLLGYHTSFFLSVESTPPIPRIVIIEWILAAARLLMIGMIISMLFRWLSHR